MSWIGRNTGELWSWVSVTNTKARLSLLVKCKAISLCSNFNNAMPDQRKTQENIHPRSSEGRKGQYWLCPFQTWNILKLTYLLISVSPSVLLVQWVSADLWVCAGTTGALCWDTVLILPTGVLPFPLGCSSSSSSSWSSSSDITLSLLPLPKAPLLRFTMYPGLAAVVHWVSMMYLWPSTQPQMACTEPQHWPSSTSFRSGQEWQASPWWWTQDTRLWRHLGSEVKDGGAERKQHKTVTLTCIPFLYEEAKAMKKGFSLLGGPWFTEDSGHFALFLKNKQTMDCTCRFSELTIENHAINTHFLAPILWKGRLPVLFYSSSIRSRCCIDCVSKYQFF